MTELVERCRAEDDDTQVDAIVELEDHVADERVLNLFVALITDTAAYDLSRIECVKILRLWPPEQPTDRRRVAHAAGMGVTNGLFRIFSPVMSK